MVCFYDFANPSQSSSDVTLVCSAARIRARLRVSGICWVSLQICWGLGMKASGWPSPVGCWTELAGELRAAAWNMVITFRWGFHRAVWLLGFTQSNNRKPQTEAPLSLWNGPRIPAGLALSFGGVKVESGSSVHSRSELMCWLLCVPREIPA